MSPKPRFDPNFLQTLQTLADNPALRQEIPDPPAPKAPEPGPAKPAAEPDGEYRYSKGQFSEDGKRCLDPERLERLALRLTRRFMEDVELDPRRSGDSPGDCVEKLSAAAFAAINVIEASFATILGITKIIHRHQRAKAAGETGEMDLGEVLQLAEQSNAVRERLGMDLFNVLRKYDLELFAEIQQEDRDAAGD